MAVPSSVPIVSNISTSENDMTIITSVNTIWNTLAESANRPAKSILNSDTSTKSENCCPMFMENPPNEVTPSGTPTIVATRMPMIIEPLILRACSAPITTSPTSATSADATSPCSSGSPHLEKSISATSVELFETTSPAFFSPISARNRPIPALIAPRTHGGIARTHASRKPIAVITINRIPEIKTIASSCP